MPWFEYTQNNSGGRFKPPYYRVSVEARTGRIADVIAEDAGVYLNGVAAGIDCGCCGDRWSRWDEEGQAEPDRSLAWTPDSFFSLESVRRLRKDATKGLLIHADGTREEIELLPPAGAA